MLLLKFPLPFAQLHCGTDFLRDASAPSMKLTGLPFYHCFLSSCMLRCFQYLSILRHWLWCLNVIGNVFKCFIESFQHYLDFHLVYLFARWFLWWSHCPDTGVWKKSSSRFYYSLTEDNIGCHYSNLAWHLMISTLMPSGTGKILLPSQKTDSFSFFVGGQKDRNSKPHH